MPPNLPGRFPSRLPRLGGGTWPLVIVVVAVVGAFATLAIFGLRGCESEVISPSPQPPPTQPKQQQQLPSTPRGATGAAPASRREPAKGEDDRSQGSGDPNQAGAADAGKAATHGSRSGSGSSPASGASAGRHGGLNGSSGAAAVGGGAPSTGSSPGPIGGNAADGRRGGADRGDKVAGENSIDAEPSQAGKVLFEGGWIEAAARQKQQEAFRQRAHAEVVRYLKLQLGDAAQPSDFHSDETRVTPSADGNGFIVGLVYTDSTTRRRRKCFAKVVRSEGGSWSVQSSSL